LYTKINESEASMVMQLTVNQPPFGTLGSIPRTPTIKNIVVEEFGLSRLPWEQEHIGSNPIYYTKLSYYKRVTHKCWCISLPMRNRIGWIPIIRSIKLKYNIMKREIPSITNKENGEVTMFLSNVNGGPIITGKNIYEAKSKFNDALKLYDAVIVLLNFKK